ncbi:oxysterol-binding protein-related protein 1C-like [Primulina huaijiensis]|uniref:oxysterol-binding protein-related protein 1C-like n=1 Tax=Primulina huaijiensis TaxID=1492673 RepID=UPI003CC74DB7
MRPFCCVTSTPISNPNMPSFPSTPPPFDPLTKSQQYPAILRISSTCGSGLDHSSGGAPNGKNILHAHSRDVKINDIVGNGISGVLYKWVNYGKGWRPRWFVLHDEVLSYYKIHGPDKIVVNQDTEKGLKVIGEESIKRISRHDHHYRNGTSGSSANIREPVGEVHLKVSSIRESRSDDKRFSIFTGTKRLFMRAESREDRMVWVEALQAVKDMFPRMSNSELMAPVEDVPIPTDKLRQRLLEERLSEAAIQESEQIMRNEFAALQNQLIMLKQKHWLCIDTLRHLEREKVDLENTVVDESQRQLKEVRASSRSRQDKCSENASQSEDENEIVDAAEEDTDEEDNTFFDTRDFLSSSSFKSSGSDFRTSSFSSDDIELYAFEVEDNIDPAIKSAGTNLPYIRRRKKLPEPIEKEQGVSLWSMIKDNIGKDLAKVCLPVYFNEPLSSLQKCFEDLEYSYLLDQAYEWGKQGNSFMRILNVAAFAVSGYASTDGRNCKPFNPLLGETYEADYPDKGLRFFSEKVSHHPMIVACHCEGTGWRFHGDSNLKSKSWGRSIQLDPVGILTLEFDDGEVFQWSKVTTSIYNLILGKLYCDHYGTMRIQGNRDYSCKLKFKEQSIIDRNPHQVQGIIQEKSGKTVASVFGKWDESLHHVNGDFTSKGKSHEPLSEAHLLWKRSNPPKFPTRYSLTRFAIILNELKLGLEEKLPPTDSRLRPDQRCLENGEYERANAEKLRLEQRQRQAWKMQERGWKARWFAKDRESDTYRYVGGYWEAKEQGNWESCPDIFGQIPADQSLDFE